MQGINGVQWKWCSDRKLYHGEWCVNWVGKKVRRAAKFGGWPIFDEKTSFAKKRSAENMDLSPLRRDFEFSCLSRQPLT